MGDILERPGGIRPPQAQSTWDEAYGASQIGMWDYCPKLGFREYWYPCIWSRKVGKKRPAHVKIMAEEIVLFRGKDGKVVALTDWCPHRGARLSRGFCEFPGTVTCPYHGYTFDETGQCVAGLIETVNSPLASKMKARKYPTAEYKGIVFIWMGITDPVPLEEDLPWELKDQTLTDRRYTRVKVWHANWTEPVNQGIDYHEFYLHRHISFHRLFHKSLPFFRPKWVLTNGVKIVEEGEDYVKLTQKNIEYGQKEYPGLDKWPKHVWWRVLPPIRRSTYTSEGNGTKKDDKNWIGWAHYVRLPSQVGIPNGMVLHLRWGVPVDDMYTRMWTFTIVKKPRTILGHTWQDLWYYLWRKRDQVISVNEQEDLQVYLGDRLNYHTPQKLGILDIGVIYFRRHLAKRSRDFQRLGGAFGCLKQPPDPERVAQWVRSK